MANEKNVSADKPQEIPGAMRGRPGPVHEALWSAIVDEVRAQVTEFAPTFGTVTGMDGGKVLVHADGEDDARTVGLTKKRGQRYKPGDRVKIAKSRSGEEFIDGSYSGKGGRDEVVGNDDLEESSVDSRQLKQNSVDKNAMGPKAVEKSALADDTTKYIDDQGKKGEDAMAEAKTKADKNHGHNISEIGGANFASQNHTHNYADKNHDHNYASNSHGHGIADISKLETRLSTIESDIKKLKERGNG